MTSISSTSTSSRGEEISRDRGERPAREGGATTLLLLDAVAGRGSLAPTDGGPPLLLGDAVAGHGSLGPTERRRPRTTRRPARASLLEDALATHVASLGHSKLKQRRLQAVIDRLGLGGRPPLTLAEAGRVAGLSGERVRQLEARLRKQQQAAAVAPVLPELDAALDAVARALPLPASAVARLLLEAGLTAGAFSAESLRCAADLLGRELPFVFSGPGRGRGCVLLPRGAATAVAHSSTIESRARRQAERCGGSTLDELERELAENEGLSVSRRQLRVVLETSGLVECLAQNWFTFRDARPVGPFVRASLRMLAVTPSLSVGSLRDGLCRHNAFRRLPSPPPAAVLAEIYRCHPSFVLEQAMVSPVAPVELSTLGPLNQRMVEILRAAPGGVLPRTHLLDACHKAGLNLTSVNLYTTYSECVERVGPGLFSARGAAVSPSTRPVAKRRPGGRSAEDGPVCGWTADGRPWLAGRVTPSIWANGVIHVPAKLRPILDGRHFPCTDSTGAHVTTLGVDCHGNSWGWTGFLRRAGAQLGDLVRAVFDPTAGTAVLDVVAAGTTSSEV